MKEVNAWEIEYMKGGLENSVLQWRLKAGRYRERTNKVSKRVEVVGCRKGRHTRRGEERVATEGWTRENYVER